MAKKYFVNIVKSTLVDVNNEREAESLGELLMTRELDSFNYDDFLSRTTYFSMNIEEACNAN